MGAASFIARLFGREPKSQSPDDLRGLNEDWRVGDLAFCIIASDFVPASSNHPKAGDVLRVSGIYEGVTVDGQAVVTALNFEGKPANHAWHCLAFRKVRPEQTAAQDEFTALIKRPARKPVRA